MPDIDKFPIVGVQPQSGLNPGVRRELRDLRKDFPDQWNLYLLGLKRFQESEDYPENNPLSYFQIAGIHGEPYQRWPDEDWNKPEIKDQESGYSLFEMQLWKHVQDVAKSYQDPALKTRYVEAAKSFRMPYWDWARPDLPIVPDETLSNPVKPLTIVDPKTGKSVPLERNPLASYPFRGAQEGFQDAELKTQASTFRENLFRTGVKKAKDDKELREGLNNIEAGGKGNNLTERVTYILNSYDEFKPMSYNLLPDYQPSNKFENYGSLEDIHNTVHGYVGGHMGSIRYSAFDPIFWLHHTNIDRVFALWQALKGGDGKGKRWVTASFTNGNFVIPPTGGNPLTSKGPKEDGDTPLAPFYGEGKKLYTSDTTRKTASFGYVYPELQSWDTKQAKLEDQLAVLYPGGSFVRMLRPKVSSKTVAQNLAVKAEWHAQVLEQHITTEQFMEQAVASAPALPKVELPKRKIEDLVKSNKYLEWLVLLEGKKYSLDGRYMVHVFLGAPDDTAPELYTQSPNQVAAFVPLGQPADTGCEKCVKDRAEGIVVTGQIPLTIALVERYLAGLLPDLQPEAVVDYLKENLHWRVTLVDGERHSRSEVEGLLVGVGSNEVTLPDGDGPPIYSPDIRMWPAATTNRNNEGRGRGTGLTVQT